jgi:hypothetical protein
MGRYDNENLYPAGQDAPAEAADPGSSSDRYDPANLYPAPEGPPAPAPYPVAKGMVLPLTRYSDNSVAFEPLSSGLVGNTYQSFKNAIDYFAKVWSGEASTDINDPAVMGNVLNAASFGVGVNPFVRSGERAIAGVAGAPLDMTLARAPTAEQLKSVGGQQIENVRNLPTGYSPQSIIDLSNRMENALIGDGVFPEDAPGLYQAVRRMRAVDPTDPNLSFAPGNLLSLRRNIANKFNSPTENQHGVGVAHSLLNDFIEAPPAGSIVGGLPAEIAAARLGDLYATGRANYAAGMRGEELADIKRSQRFSAAAANSGQNVDNALRQGVKRMVLDESRTRGFTPQEITQLENVPLGTKVRNLLRSGGNLLGGGGGLGSTFTTAAAGGAANVLGAPPWLSTAVGLAAPAAGAYLKNQAAKGTVGALDALDVATRQRSPLFREQLPAQDLIPNPTAGRDAIARAWLQMNLPPLPQPAPPQRYTIEG